MKRLFFTALFAGLAATTGRAVLGETLAQLKEHMGKPEEQPRKDAAVWFFEVEAGRLVYNVTFDDKGRSIAEGVKPLKQAVFTGKAAQDFIGAQLALVRDSKTVRTFQPGESYVFGGKSFTCGEQEFATVDDANDLAVVWNRSRSPSVIAFRSVMVK